MLDATYGRSRERAELRRLARRLGVPLVVLVCQADERILRARLAAPAQDTHTTSDARLELWPALRAAYTAPQEVAEVFTIDTAQSPAGSLEDALAVVRSARHQGRP